MKGASFKEAKMKKKRYSIRHLEKWYRQPFDLAEKLQHRAKRKNCNMTINDCMKYKDFLVEADRTGSLKSTMDNCIAKFEGKKP